MEKIYLAHSISDYNTDYEKEKFREIEERFGCEYDYINPGCPEIEKELKKHLSLQPNKYARFKAEMDFFYDKINKCFMLVAIPESKTGRFTGGVKQEIAHAVETGIDVKKLIFKDDFILLDIITKDDILQLKKWKESKEIFWSVLEQESYEDTEIF